ncbi:hypothetical protein BC830DRAFT_1166849 [Chytriomyces sp. MP71]|nr:hypothetical protein BC830DRAFT_1166849 [Chytriomyces sp. MP71]
MTGSLDYHRSWSDSAKNVYMATTGAVAGAVLGVVAGQGPVGYSFGMGSNWLLVSLPFFAMREAIIRHRQSLNAIYSHRQPAFQHRDADEAFASTLSGSVIGGCLAHYTRGPLAVAGGAIMFGGLGLAGQSLFTFLRHKRQEAAFRLKHAPTLQQNEEEPVSLKHNKIRSESDPHFDDHGWDPLRDATEYLQKMVGNAFGGEESVPAWASPMVNALDLEYRKRLNIKIDILERQCASLRYQLKQRGIALPDSLQPPSEGK